MKKRSVIQGVMFEGSKEFNAAWYISRRATWCFRASFLQLSYSGEKLGGELEEMPIFPSTLPKRVVTWWVRLSSL